MTEPQHRPGTYLGIFAALILLTGTTVAAGFVHLGPLHFWVGIGIAAAKALLVLLFFMHLLHSSRLTWMVAFGALVWLGILLSWTLMDYATRWDSPNQEVPSVVRPHTDPLVR